MSDEVCRVRSISKTAAVTHPLHISVTRFSGYGDSFKFKVLGQIHLSQPEWNERSYILHQVHKSEAGKHSEDDGTISIDWLPHRHLSREHSEKRKCERDYMDDNDHYKSRDHDRKRSFDRKREERHRPGSRSGLSSRS
ncbi:hypothetical protein F2Q70_00015559 [Brassica cretica]|uniref:Uncharacterized protein n=1 Tax=Brassica cretica TaxID=69181 RepID=A0A8S9I0F5_BRACR|nr:hypothetical protein F2Q70_00015559 [Brassica cretica]